MNNNSINTPGNKANIAKKCLFLSIAIEAKKYIGINNNKNAQIHAKGSSK